MFSQALRQLLAILITLVLTLWALKGALHMHMKLTSIKPWLSPHYHYTYRALGLLASHYARCPVAQDNGVHPLDFLMQTLQFPLGSNSGIQRMCASLILTEWASCPVVNLISVHCALLCISLVFSSDSQQSGILIPWIWSANHVHSSASDFPLQNFQLFVALNNSVNCKDSTSKLYGLFLLPMPDTFVRQIWIECLY